MPAASRWAALKATFDGLWRPIYEPPGPDAAPDVLSLVDGTFECRSCRPPYRVPADGMQHAVEGHPRFDTIAAAVIDDRTVHQVGRRAGLVSFESTSVVADDGMSRSETWTAALPIDGVLMPLTAPMVPAPGDPGRPVLFAMSAVRIGSRPPTGHSLSGTWRVVELDLVHHDEDTTYRVEGSSLTMSDHLGRSFAAPLDGAVAPYLGDPRITGVSVRVIDQQTIEESDLKDGVVVQVLRWHVDRDGTTMHVRFDDTRGHVMEQTGRKLA